MDEIVGQRQVVMKGLPTGMTDCPFLGGATILGDGQISLILDPGGLRDAGAVPDPTRAPRQEVA